MIVTEQSKKKEKKRKTKKNFGYFVESVVYIFLHAKMILKNAEVQSSPDPLISKVLPPGFGSSPQLPPASDCSTAEPGAFSPP